LLAVSRGQLLSDRLACPANPTLRLEQSVHGVQHIADLDYDHPYLLSILPLIPETAESFQVSAPVSRARFLGDDSRFPGLLVRFSTLASLPCSRSVLICSGVFVFSAWQSMEPLRGSYVFVADRWLAICSCCLARSAWSVLDLVLFACSYLSLAVGDNTHWLDSIGAFYLYPDTGALC